MRATHWAVNGPCRFPGPSVGADFREAGLQIATVWAVRSITLVLRRPLLRLPLFSIHTPYTDVLSGVDRLPTTQVHERAHTLGTKV